MKSGVPGKVGSAGEQQVSAMMYHFFASDDQVTAIL
jgi:hypothetical protein